MDRQQDSTPKHRYNIVCEKARRLVKGIECILDMVDDGDKFHDSVVERFDFDAENKILVVDIGDVWDAEQAPAGRYRFIFRGYMEFEFNYETGNSFTYEMQIYDCGRGDMLKVEFNSLHLHVICRDIEVMEYPYTEEELKKFT